MGYWVVAIRPGEKRPIGAAWGAERWTEARLNEAFEKHAGCGIGICCGPGRGPRCEWLVDLEGDGEKANDSLGRLLGNEIDETVSWYSTRGSHFLFAVDGNRLLKALGSAGAKESGVSGVWHLADLSGLEFRVGGTKPDGIVKQLQSVAPPTPGTDGNPRKWIGSPRVGIAPLPETAYRFLEGLRPVFKASHKTPPNLSGTGYGKSALEREIADFSSKSAGERHAFLLGSTLRLASLVKAKALSEADAIQGLKDAASRNGFEGEGRLGEIDEAWRSAMAMANARDIPDRNGKPSANGGGHGERNGHSPIGTIEAGGRLIVLASEVETRRVEWLWPNRIPIGKLTTFAGWGGLGKSFVTMDLASRISRGGEIPGMGGECFERSRVLILNTEDDPDDTSVPRLIEAGADLSMIGFARSEVLGKFTLEDLAVLDDMLAQLGDARLLVIDPATAHLGEASDNSNAELRGLLMPLSLWAMLRRIAVVLVTHVNKPQAGKVEAMSRVVGSVAWVNAVRAAVMFARDPEDRTLRLFIPFKSNNAPEQKGLSYRVVPTEALAKVEWIGEVDTSADEAMNGEEKAPRAVVASRWLIDRFTDKLRWFSEDLVSAARQEGISRNALFEAKKELDLPPCQKETMPGGKSAWVWWVPPDWEHFPKITETVETLETLDTKPF